MSTRSGEPGREGLAALVATLALLLAACSLGGEGVRGEGVPPGSEATTASDAVSTLLERRASAVRQGERRRFLADVARQARGEERAYYDNLRRLPLAMFDYRLVPDSVRDRGGEVVAAVRLRTRLRGYDDAAVVTRHRLTFRRDRRGRLRLLDDTTVRDAGAAAPWELVSIRVRSRAGVLGVFDEDSVRHAPEIMSAVVRGVAEVAREVPLRWDRRVVVYALSGTRVLASIDDLPGGEPARLDAVAFPVAARAGGDRLAAHRVILHPRMLTENGPARARLIRHELTHVVVGRRDDGLPVWLAEGIAEYVSVQPMPPGDRRISSDALARARGGLDELPDDDTFNGPGSGGNYGIAWWACAYIAETYGEPALWQLLEEMGRALREEPATAPAQVLREELGVGPRRVARQAGRRIVATFG